MKKSNWIFIGIIIIAATLRLWSLSSIPNSLNIDEQALGYNAYSLFKTGLDEHGKFFPISLESYGDWKLIGYPIFTIPGIAFLGLNELSIRLPSALAGIAQVILIYFLALKLFANKRIAIFSSLLLAVSPWSIYFSRIAYEVNLATGILLGALVAFLAYIHNPKKPLWFFLSCLFFSLTIFIYHSFIIFIPLFTISLFLLCWKKIEKNWKIFFSLLIFLTAILFVGKSVIFSNSSKLSNLAVWTDQNTIYNRGDIFRSDGSNDKFLGKIFYSKPFIITYQISQNYIATFSPTFLFDKGGQKLVNSLGYFGNFYILDVVLLIAGFIGLISFKVKERKVLLLWLLFGIIPSAITKDAPSATRLFLLLPLAILILGCGAEVLWQFGSKGRLKKFSFLLFAILYCGNIIYFFDAYFLHINYQRARFLHYGFKQIVELSQKYPQDKIVMTGPDNFPYISFLLYTKYDPNKFRKEVVYYPRQHGFFNEVKSFGRYNFVDKIGYTHLEQGTLYVDDKGIRNVDATINLPNGEPLFKYFTATE